MLDHPSVCNVVETLVDVAKLVQLVDQALSGTDVEEHGSTLGEHQQTPALPHLLEPGGGVGAEVGNGTRSASAAGGPVGAQSCSASASSSCTTGSSRACSRTTPLWSSRSAFERLDSALTTRDVDLRMVGEGSEAGVGSGHGPAWYMVRTETTMDLFTSRLGGERIPADLAALLARRGELEERTRITLFPSGEPWSDKSYLTPTDLADPEIAANSQAIDETNALVAWVAIHGCGDFLGYWRGHTGRPVADSPIVLLNSEGQYQLFAGGFAAALLDLPFVDAVDLEAWYAEIGLDPGPATGPVDYLEANNWRDARFEAILGR